MLIGVDASRAVSDRPTGTETYSRQLIQALLSRPSSHRFRLYFRRPPAADLLPDADIRTMPFPRLWTHVRLAWEMMRHPPDVLFVPAHVLPPVHPRRSLVTIHDLGYLTFPQAHPWGQRLYLDLSTRWNAGAAAHVLTDSTATKMDLVTRYHVDPDKITVAYPGVDASLRAVQEAAIIEATKTHYGIERDYFLYLGTLQPRKNLGRLVEAFAQFTDRHPSSGVQLILAGKRGWLWERLSEEIEKQGLDERILLPGYVTDEDKAALLTGATAFVFPSLHEGFGLPVLEAQACGCPVVTSTTSSLPEVAGDAAILVDPQETAALADALERLFIREDLRAELAERGLANVRRFSWDACAETVLRVMESAL